MGVCGRVGVYSKTKEIGRFGTLATSKMEIFAKEINGEKPLVIDTRRMVLDLPLAV